MSNDYEKAEKFRDKLSGKYIDEQEYLHRLEFLLGDIVQILETATIDDTSRKTIYSKIAGMNNDISRGCAYQFHQRYMNWCKLNKA